MGKRTAEAKRAAAARRERDQIVRALSGGGGVVIEVLAAALMVVGGWPEGVARAAAVRAFAQVASQAVGAESAREMVSEAVRIADEMVVE